MGDSHDGGPDAASVASEPDGRRAAPTSRSAGTGERADRGSRNSQGRRRAPDRGVADSARAETGQVYLVGAGPGDPDLLTRRAWALLERAEAVLHDSLTATALLRELPPGATVVDVGKRPPNPVSQEGIHERLTARAAAGETVVRLKGGDPSVFGRGGEEAEHLAAEGIPFEVVPGVSSVLAAPGVAGIPLTHREHASSLTVVTGHEAPDKAESALDWAAIADTVDAGGTLVVLMGVSHLPDYVGRLREEGIPGDTPVALVQRATWPDERTVTSTLAAAVDDARDAGVEPPAVTIVGDVVAVRDRVEAALRRD